MTPTLVGRMQTRLLLLSAVGLPWTVVITPLLPRPSFVSLGIIYRITLEGIAAVALVGLAWELAYHALQQLRFDKDWPSLFALATIVNESACTWLVLHGLHAIPGTTALSSPILEPFALHFASTWILVWLVTQGPLRVVVLRWRYEGGRIPMTARPGGRPGLHTPYPNPDPASTPFDPLTPSPRAAAAYGPAAQQPACKRGHPNPPLALYCSRCGVSLRS